MAPVTGVVAYLRKSNALRRLARQTAIFFVVIAFAYAIASIGAASTSRVWHIAGTPSGGDVAGGKQGPGFATMESSLAKLHGEVASLKARADGSRKSPDALETEAQNGDVTGSVPDAEGDSSR